MKQTHVYVLDLSILNGSGDFSCPRCGTTISPDDCTEMSYSILETKVDDHGLDELMIRCNKCESNLHLTGFPLLQELAETDERPEKKKEKPRCFVDHI